MLTRIIAITLLFVFNAADPAFALSSLACSIQGGTTVNNMMGKGCPTGKNIGEISGMECPCICCVGEKLIDCKNNTVEIYDVCDAGDELHYKFKYHGSEIPTSIEIRLMSADDDEYSADGVSGKIISGQEQQKISYDYDFIKNQNYTKLIYYQVHYKNFTLGGCKNNLITSPINIKQCDK